MHDGKGRVEERGEGKEGVNWKRLLLPPATARPNQQAAGGRRVPTNRLMAAWRTDRRTALSHCKCGVQKDRGCTRIEDHDPSIGTYFCDSQVSNVGIQSFSHLTTCRSYLDMLQPPSHRERIAFKLRATYAAIKFTPKRAQHELFMLSPYANRGDKITRSNILSVKVDGFPRRSRPHCTVTTGEFPGLRSECTG